MLIPSQELDRDHLRLCSSFASYSFFTYVIALGSSAPIKNFFNRKSHIAEIVQETQGYFLIKRFTWRPLNFQNYKTIIGLTCGSLQLEEDITWY